MKVCSCFLLFGIFAYTNASRFAQEKSKSVVIVPKNVEENSKNDFDTTDKTVTGDSNIPKPYSNVETFTDFITEVINILNTYKDDTFEDFVHISDKEVRNHFKNHDIKTLLDEQLDLILKKPVSEMKAVVSQAAFGMILIKFDDNMKKYIEHINSLYKDNAKDNFRKILTELKSYDAGYGKTRTKDDFVNIIREFMKASVFNYDDLNTDLIRELRKYIAPFFKNTKESSSTTSSTTKFIRFEPTVNNLDRYNVKNTEKMSTEDIISIDSSKENRRRRRVNIAPRAVKKINNKEHFKNEFTVTDIVTKSDKHNVNITNKISTKDKILKTSLETYPTTRTVHLKAENKRTIIFRTETSEAKEEDKTRTLERTSKKGESSSQQKKITDSITDGTVMEVMRYVTMEEPVMFYKSERRSKIVERMMGEESAGRKRGRTTAQTITKQGLRLSTESSLRRIKPVPLPEEELSLEVFDRDRSRNKKKDVVQELKDYMKRIRQIKKEVNRLKKIYEINQNSKTNVITERDVENLNVIETKDKQYNNEGRVKENRRKNKLVSGGQSHKYEARVLREKNKVKYAENNAEFTARNKRDKNKVKNAKESVESEVRIQREENKVKSNDKVVESEERIERETNVLRNSERKNKIINNISEGRQDLDISDEIVRSDDNNAQKSEFTRKKSKKYKKYATTCNCDTVDAETITKLNKKESKKNKVPRIIEPLATAKDNIDNSTVNNKKLDNNRFKTTNKLDNRPPNVSKELKQNRIGNTVTDSYNKVTEDNKNEVLPNHKFRRVLDSFPSLFEGNTLKEGLYPAHLWD